MTKKKSTALTIVLIAVILILLVGSIQIVPTGFVGVRSTFGQISDNVIEPGFSLKLPIVQSLTRVDVRQTDVGISSQIWGESSEKTPCYAEGVTVTYRINGSKAAYICANYSSDASDLITYSLVASSVKSAMVRLDAEHVTIRTQVEPLVLEELRETVAEKYGDDTLDVIKVVIDQMDFEDSYNEAIAAKSIARQNLERQAIENDTNVAKAEADKKVAIAAAEAQAETARIAAEAEAEVIKITAAAQAEANKTIADSLTDQVLRSKFYETWNGELPNVMSDGTVITDIGQ